MSAILKVWPSSMEPAPSTPFDAMLATAMERCAERMRASIATPMFGPRLVNQFGDPITSRRYEHDGGNAIKVPVDFKFEPKQVYTAVNFT